MQLVRLFESSIRQAACSLTTGKRLNRTTDRSLDEIRGPPPSHVLDSAEPVLSAVEGLHPGYFADEYVILSRSQSGGEESLSISAKARFFVASLLRMTSIKITWLEY